MSPSRLVYMTVISELGVLRAHEASWRRVASARYLEDLHGSHVEHVEAEAGDSLTTHIEDSVGQEDKSSAQRGLRASAGAAGLSLEGWATLTGDSLFTSSAMLPRCLTTAPMKTGRLVWGLRSSMAVGNIREATARVRAVTWNQMATRPVCFCQTIASTGPQTVYAGGQRPLRSVVVARSPH